MHREGAEKKRSSRDWSLLRVSDAPEMTGETV